MSSALRVLARLSGAAALAALLPGCLMFPWVTRTTTGALLPEDRVAALTPGKTTAAEVLESFGPPLAVVREPRGLVRVPGVGIRRDGGEELQAEALFAKFGPGAALPGDVVYYYRAHQVRTPGSGVLLVVGKKADLVGSSRDEDRDERLWILVDGATGLVRARVHERDEPPRPGPAVAEDAAPDEGAP